MLKIGPADAALRNRAEKVIPHGMYGHMSVGALPLGWPQFISRAEGARLWDVDGKEYLDLLCAFGPNLLGYGHPTVEAAAEAQRRKVNTVTGVAPAMVELAEAFVSMVSHADWAMFAKNGTDVTTMATTIARAHTGKRIILLCGGAYHGAAPWCTPVPSGTLPEDRAHLRYYTYNDIDSLEAAVAAAGDDLAGIIASPFKHDLFVDQATPTSEYALRCRELCDKAEAVLIVDDVRAGLRLARDCSWSLVGVEPDLSCWGKGIANGLSIAAILGSEHLREAASSIFVTGSFWFSAVPMAAALATLEVVKTSNYLEHTVALGNQLRAGLAEQATRHGFSLRQTGPVQMPLVLFADDGDQIVGAAFCEEMISRGVLFHPYHNMFLCAAMTAADMKLAVDVAGEAFAGLAKRRGSLVRNENVMGLLSLINAA